MTQVLSAMPTRFHSHSKFYDAFAWLDRRTDGGTATGGGHGQGAEAAAFRLWRPPLLAFSECANSGMMPTGFISARAARGAAGSKDGKSRRVLAEVAPRFAVVGTGRGIGWRARAEPRRWAGLGAGRHRRRPTEGFSCCQLPVSRSRRRGAKPETIKPLS